MEAFGLTAFELFVAEPLLPSTVVVVLGLAWLALNACPDEKDMLQHKAPVITNNINFPANILFLNNNPKVLLKL